MNLNRFLLLVSLGFAVVIYSCTKEKVQPGVPPPSQDQRLFLVGYTGVDNRTTPAYWENGVVTPLTSDWGQVTALDSDDSTKIYSVGYLFSSITQVSLWTNCKRDTFTGNAFGYDLKVSGDDVYIVGSLDGHATYWKNGVSTTLTTEQLSSETIRMVIHESDVYMGVVINNSDLFTHTSVYWKNGIRHPLSSSVILVDMAFYNGDIYLLGIEDGTSTCVIWKNETAIYSFAGKISSDGKNYSYTPTGIDLQNGHIYVSGIETDVKGNAPCYWNIVESTGAGKDSPVLLPYDTTHRWVYANSVKTKGGDVYISGEIDFGISLLWKNGKLIQPFDGITNSDPSSFHINRICVTNK